MDIFDDVEEIIFIIPGAGNFAGIRIEKDTLEIDHRPEDRDRGIIVFIYHEFPTSLRITVGDDIINGFIRTERRLSDIFEPAQGEYAGSRGRPGIIPLGMRTLRNLFLKNKNAAGDADDKHHQPGRESEPEVYLTIV